MQSDSDKSKYLFLLCFIDYASFGLPYLRVNLRGLSHEEHRSIQFKLPVCLSS